MRRFIFAACDDARNSRRAEPVTRGKSGKICATRFSPLHAVDLRGKNPDYSRFSPSHLALSRFGFEFRAPINSRRDSILALPA